MSTNKPSSGGKRGSSKTRLQTLLQNFEDQNGIWPGQYSSGQTDTAITLSPAQTRNDYTDDNNPELINWQGLDDTAAGSYLHNVDRNVDLAAIQASTNDPWAFYDNPQQKLLLQLGINKPTTVLSEADFNNYVKTTGATVLYRGWSGKDAVDRFKKSPNNHIGNGINGDGYYFSADKSTARSYGNYGQKAALSPSARVVSLEAVNNAINNSSSRFRRSLQLAGSRGTRTYGVNEGQAQMALKMGYNSIDAGWAVIPLTKDAVVVSSKRAW